MTELLRTEDSYGRRNQKTRGARPAKKRCYSLISYTEIENNRDEHTWDLGGYEESEEENFYHGFDTETNDYSLEQLDKDITRTQQSKEYRDLISILKKKVEEKYPERLRKS